MRVFLLQADRDRTLFYSEDEEPPAPVSAGWLSRKAHKFKQKLIEAEHKLSPRMIRLWNRLQRQTFPDEPLLRKLRNASTIEIHFPPTLTEPEARGFWATYLQARMKRHWLWLGCDAVLAFISIFLSPLPGPNILMYWFFYRIGCHVFAVRGLRRAAREAAGTPFLVSSILVPGEGSFADIAEKLGFVELDDFLSRSLERPAADPVQSSASCES